MRNIRHLAALAGSVATVAAGALALAIPASAASTSAARVSTPAGHSAVLAPQLDSTTIVLNKVETDGADNAITFCDETNISVVAHLNPSHNDTPLGTAEIDANIDGTGRSVFVCDINTWDKNSHFGDCGTAANNTLPPGSYTFTAFFQGTGVLAKSVSNSVAVTVSEENSTLSPIPNSSLTMTYGSETADKFNFTVTPQFPNTGTAPTGKVTAFFAASGTTLCDAPLDGNGSGSCSISNNFGIDPDIQLNVGTYGIEAEYPGDGNYNGDNV